MKITKKDKPESPRIIPRVLLAYARPRGRWVAVGIRNGEVLWAFSRHPDAGDRIELPKGSRRPDDALS